MAIPLNQINRSSRRARMSQARSIAMTVSGNVSNYSLVDKRDTLSQADKDRGHHNYQLLDSSKSLVGYMKTPSEVSAIVISGNPVYLTHRLGSEIPIN